MIDSPLSTLYAQCIGLYEEQHFPLKSICPPDKRRENMDYNFYSPFFACFSI